MSMGIVCMVKDNSTNDQVSDNVTLPPDDECGILEEETTYEVCVIEIFRSNKYKSRSDSFSCILSTDFICTEFISISLPGKVSNICLSILFKPSTISLKKEGS